MIPCFFHLWSEALWSSSKSHRCNNGFAFLRFLEFYVVVGNKSNCNLVNLYFKLQLQLHKNKKSLQLQLFKNMQLITLNYNHSCNWFNSGKTTLRTAQQILLSTLQPFDILNVASNLLTLVDLVDLSRWYSAADHWPWNWAKKAISLHASVLWFYIAHILADSCIICRTHAWYMNIVVRCLHSVLACLATRCAIVLCTWRVLWAVFSVIFRS